MILKDGIYEVKDLFYENAGYTLVVVGDELDFAEGTGPAVRLKLEVLYPRMGFSKLMKVPDTVSSERCEFDKNLVKTILLAKTESEITKRFNRIMKAMTECSLFESTFVIGRLSAGGLVFRIQDKDAPIGKSPDRVKPDQIISILCHIFLNDPSFFDFNQSMDMKVQHGDPEDIKLHRQLISEPHVLKPTWGWTEKDSEECLAILEANPYLRNFLSN